VFSGLALAGVVGRPSLGVAYATHEFWPTISALKGRATFVWSLRDLSEGSPSKRNRSKDMGRG
jgi:hypothetical protein